jgi:hypothetical protein
MTSVARHAVSQWHVRWPIEQPVHRFVGSLHRKACCTCLRSVQRDVVVVVVELSLALGHLGMVLAYTSIIRDI